MTNSELEKTKGIEAWVCYSTISLNLYESWAKLAHRHARVFLAPGTPLLRENSSLRSELQNRSDVEPYNLRKILSLAALSCLSGSRLRIRVPHLNQPTCHKHLLALARLRLIQLALYDDGFLGVVENPAVCNYLRPVFASLCSWNIQGWKLSSATNRCLSAKGGIEIFQVPVEDLCIFWRKRNQGSEKNLLIIIEAKYMDYVALNCFIEQISIPEHYQAQLEMIPKYFEHPWEIKRNIYWPPDRKRDLLHESPVEQYLSRSISADTHVVTGMTSSAVILCDLIKKKALPSCRISLLLSSSQSDKEYHRRDELESYASFMKETYSSVVELEITLDGHQLEPS